MDYFARNAVQVEYDDEERASFIGISQEHTLFLVTFQGENVFDIAATELFEIVARTDGSPDGEYDPRGHVFPNLIVTLWEADEDYDNIRLALGEAPRAIWAQIGIGTRAYLEAVWQK